MSRQPILENSVVVRIMHDLRKHPAVVVRKRHGTAMGVGGDPDLYGSVRGRHFEIEVKRPNDPYSQLTKLQAQRLLEWKLAGAITGVARSSAEALQILGLPDLAPVLWLCSGCRDYQWQGSKPPACCPACSHIHFEREAQR